jgi:hypothetical protein
MSCILNVSLCYRFKGSAIKNSIMKRSIVFLLQHQRRHCFFDGVCVACVFMAEPRTRHQHIVIAAGTSVANGSYHWSEGSAFSTGIGLDGWRTTDTIAQSSDGGSSWRNGLNESTYPQFAINATAVPEPGVLGLLACGGLLSGLRRS